MPESTSAFEENENGQKTHHTSHKRRKTLYSISMRTLPPLQHRKLSRAQFPLSHHHLPVLSDILTWADVAINLEVEAFDGSGSEDRVCEGQVPD